MHETYSEGGRTKQTRKRGELAKLILLEYPSDHLGQNHHLNLAHHEDEECARAVRRRLEDLREIAAQFGKLYQDRDPQQCSESHEYDDADSQLVLDTHGVQNEHCSLDRQNHQPI